MIKEEIFEALADIDTEFIEEASQIQRKSHGLSIKKGLLIVATICLVIIIGTQIQRKMGVDSKDYRAIAADLGTAEMSFGATSPRIIYADAQKVIMYDYIGIWVYDLKKEALTGYCDFRPIDMTQVQGYPCVFVQASKDGSKVRFYMNDGSANYLYDVKKDNYEKVDGYDDDFIEYHSYVKYNSADPEGLSTYSDTFEMINAENCYVSYTLDNVDEEQSYEVYGLHYRDVKLLVEREGEISEYHIFDN